MYTMVQMVKRRDKWDLFYLLYMLPPPLPHIFDIKRRVQNLFTGGSGGAGGSGSSSKASGGGVKSKVRNKLVKQQSANDKLLRASSLSRLDTFSDDGARLELI